jgi:hypothetical protein
MDLVKIFLVMLFVLIPSEQSGPTVTRPLVLQVFIVEKAYEFRPNVVVNTGKRPKRHDTYPKPKGRRYA